MRKRCIVCIHATDVIHSDPAALEAFKAKRRAAQKAYRERLKSTLDHNDEAGSSSLADPPQAGSSSVAINPVPVPSSIPIDPALESHPSQPPSVSPIRQLDLVSGIRGIQVPESATTIEWSGGLETIAPTLEVDNGNLLAFDEAYVRRVASYPQALPGSSFIEFLDLLSYKHPFDLVLDIRKALSIGHPVVVRDFQHTDSFEFTTDGLLRSFGLSPNMLLDIHGKFRRFRQAQPERFFKTRASAYMIFYVPMSQEHSLSSSAASTTLLRAVLPSISLSLTVPCPHPSGAWTLFFIASILISNSQYGR